MADNFLTERYQELQAIERTAFSVVPLPMSAIKAGIKDVALPVGATIAASHLPIAGPVIAGAIGQGAHLASAGTHVLANAGLAHVGTQIAGALPTGLGIQTTAAAIGGATNSVALGIIDSSSYAVGGVAAAAMMGKTLVNSGKLAFNKATSQPITQTAREGWNLVNQAASKTAQFFKNIESQINQFISKIQGKAMAEDLNQNQQPVQDTVANDAQTVAESNGVVVQPPDRKEQYVQLLSENLDESTLTWEEIQERINQDPELAWEYDEKVVDQAMQNGMEPEEARELIDSAPEWDGIERPKPAVVDEPVVGLGEDQMEARTMINEDILEKMGRAVDLRNLSIRMNGEQVLGLGRDGAFLEDKTTLTTVQAQIIRDALDNPKAHPGTEITIKIGTRVAFRLKDGIVQPDKFNLANPSQELAVSTPKATQEQINKLSPEQKDVIKSLKNQGIDTEGIVDKMVYKTQTNKPVETKTPERETALSR